MEELSERMKAAAAAQAEVAARKASLELAMQILASYGIEGGEMSDGMIEVDPRKVLAGLGMKL